MTRTVLRRRLGALWQHGFVEISVLQVLIALAVLVGADTAYDAIGDSLGGGVFDELAHLATALVCLGLLPPRWRRAILAPALVGSVLIDADHIPQYLFGDDGFTVGTPRPYTHSLLTGALLLALAAAWRGRGRRVWLGLTIGLALHFVRDLAEGSGAGVSLLWPLSDHAVTYPHRAYLVLMGGAATISVLLLARRRLLGPVLVAGALLIALVLGACGSSGPAGPTSTSSPPSTGSVSVSGSFGPAPRTVAGLFHEDCQPCHSLAGPASPSQQGGSLAGLHLTQAQTAAQIAEMPQLNGPLTGRQVSELTRYVRAVTRH